MKIYENDIVPLCYISSTCIMHGYWLYYNGDIYVYDYDESDCLFLYKNSKTFIETDIICDFKFNKLQYQVINELLNEEDYIRMTDILNNIMLDKVLNSI